jgi:hypothetical protein
MSAELGQMKGQMVAVEQASIAKKVQYPVSGGAAAGDLIC